MFSSEKVLQIIGYLLSLNDGKMNQLKLMKELYLIDRLSIEERETSVSGDIYFSMKHGPVLSATLNLLDALGTGNAEDWSKYLASEKAKYFPDIRLKEETGTGHLSKKDKSYIEAVSTKFKSTSEFDLEEFTHNLPEWTDPGGSSKKIKYSDIMKALGYSEPEIATAKAEYEAITNLYGMLGA